MNLSESNSSASRPVPPNHPLTQSLKKKLGQLIHERLDECANLWKTISSKQTIITGLITDQIKVSSKLCSYNDLWSTATRDSHFSDIHTFHQFTQLDEQVQQLSQELEQFEQKLFPTAGVVRSLVRDWRTYFTSLRETLNTISGAESVNELEKVELPSLEWCSMHFGHEVEFLLQEWEQLQLDDKISGCLSQLESHLQSEEIVESNHATTDL